MKLGVHQNALAEALAGSDEAWVFRPEDLSWSLDDALAGAGQVHIGEDIDDIVASAVATAAKGDRIVVMSNGGFGGIHQQFEQALSDRFER